MNVATLLASAARRVPDRAAWIYGDDAASYHQTRERVARLAAGLRSQGLRSGDRAVLVLPNGPDLFELLWATMWAGLVAVPLNRHLHAREVAYVLAHSEASLVVVAQDTDGAVAEVEPGSITVLRTGTTAYRELEDAEPMKPEPVQPDDPAWLFYTSGTTGKPKGAMLSHRNLMSMTLNYYADVDPVADDAVYLHAAPLTHGSGLYLLPTVGHGATNVISASARFDPRDYVTLARAHRVTHGAFLAPTMLRRLTDAVAAAPAELPHLRSLVVGGAALYEQDLRQALDVFGPIITQMYGQGEAPMTIAVMPPRDLPAATANRRGDHAGGRSPASKWRSWTTPALPARRGPPVRSVSVATS